jgi:hypothetical protein
MERFDLVVPDADSSDAAAVPATPPRARGATAKRQRPLKAADTEPADDQPAEDKPPANAAEPHTKRTFYVRTAHVERLDAEHRRLNYELNGVRLVEVLDAVLDEGFKHFADVEARLRDRG